MTIMDYIRSKAVTLCFYGIGIIILMVLFSITSGVSFAIMAAGVLLALIFIWLIMSFSAIKARLRKLESISAGLSQKYLLAELLPKPVTPEENEYFQVLKEVSRSAVGAAEQAAREKDEYQDYVERWIHELKTPLTACSLILDNSGDVKKLKRELKRAENLTESILYYARLRTPGKDIKISSFSLKDIADEAVKSQMELLIASGLSVEINGEARIYSDAKAIEFIIRQLLINSAKYCPGCHISIDISGGSLELSDNGIGIPSYELARVTERGFTGTNGRKFANSTGMGLYIVSGLCQQLGIELNISSRQGEFTSIRLDFPYENVRES